MQLGFCPDYPPEGIVELKLVLVWSAVFWMSIAHFLTDLADFVHGGSYFNI